MTHQEPVLEIKKNNDKKIAEILAQNHLTLTLDEAKKVVKLLGRNPTLTEAHIWSIQGSEHCSYKSSRKHLKMLPTTGPNVILGPSEDSGIIEITREPAPKGVRGRGAIGKKIGIVISHESHNHPSQVVPYEGAATGVGGCVRDVLCMGAQVIATADGLRFGETKNNAASHIAGDVIDGIAGYGNPIGVPNLAGDTYYNKNFNDNCLVNVVAVGVLKEEEIIHSFAPQGAAQKGYDIILVGKPTDYSGMGGAAFASLTLDESEKEKNKGAVQEPNPFLKRHIMQSTYELFEIFKKKGVLEKVGFKDLGAGGVVCVTVEMTAKAGYGAHIDLRKVPVSIPDLPPHVIACSETQERMCWIVPKELTKLVLKHYNETWALPQIAAGACAAVIGNVTRGNFVLSYDGTKVCDAKGGDITEGLVYNRAFKPRKIPSKDPVIKEPKDLNKSLLAVLSHENIACRMPVYESYDKDVQGLTVIEPGWADAGVMAPLWNRTDVSDAVKNIGIALKLDANPRYGEIDPYWQAANAVVEGSRNVAAVGAIPWCITDCLNYGSPEKPEQMWEFVRGVEGIRDALVGIGLDLGQDDIIVDKKPRRGPKIKKKKVIERFALPCISGNVSFYNLSQSGAIPPQALIATLGKLPDVHKAITMQIKGTGHELFLIGPRLPEMGGSVYYDINGELGASVPHANFERASREIKVVTRLITASLVESCHDIGDGGVATTVAEMCMGGMGNGNIGAKIDITKTADIGLGMRGKKNAKKKKVELRSDVKLFSETGGFILEIKHDKVKQAYKIAERFGVPLIRIGQTTEKRNLVIYDAGKEVISLTLNELKSAWIPGLRNKM